MGGSKFGISLKWDRLTIEFCRSDSLSRCSEWKQASGFEKYPTAPSWKQLLKGGLEEGDLLRSILA